MGCGGMGSGGREDSDVREGRGELGVGLVYVKNSVVGTVEVLGS